MTKLYFCNRPYTFIENIFLIKNKTFFLKQITFFKIEFISLQSQFLFSAWFSKIKYYFEIKFKKRVLFLSFRNKILKFCTYCESEIVELTDTKLKKKSLSLAHLAVINANKENRWKVPVAKVRVQKCKQQQRSWPEKLVN